MKTLSPSILAMYLGSQFVLRIRDTNEHSSPMHFDLYVLKAAITPETHPDHIKPILCLRKLSSITEEEARELFEVVIGTWEGGLIKSRKMADGSIEVICYDLGEDDDNPSDNELFEGADNNENLLRIEIRPTFNIWKGYEHDYNEVYDWKTHVDIFAYLLPKFDIFNLIEDGLAIDRDSLNDDKQ